MGLGPESLALYGPGFKLANQLKEKWKKKIEVLRESGIMLFMQQ